MLDLIRQRTVENPPEPDVQIMQTKEQLHLNKIDTTFLFSVLPQNNTFCLAVNMQYILI